MSQDMTLTRPIGDGSGQTTGEAVPNEVPRRRLSSWQVAPGATDNLAPPLPTPISEGHEASAANIVSLPEPDVTAPLSTSAAPATVPLPRQPTTATDQTAAWAAPETVPLDPTPQYVPTASDLTLPYSEREARRMEWEAQHAQASTVHLHQAHQTVTATVDDRHAGSTAPMPGHAETAPIARLQSTPTPSADVTAPMADSAGDSTVALAGGLTVQISPTDTAELALLRQRVDDDPDDADAALELALALREAGQIAEATSILTSLYAYFEANGAIDEASQIRRILGDVATTDIGGVTPTADLAGAATTEIGLGPSSSATAPMGSTLGRTTTRLATRTAPLGDRDRNVRDGRRRPKSVEVSASELLPRAQLVVTDPLTLMDGLTPDGARLFATAEEEREAGHLRSTLDTLTLAMTTSPQALGLWVRAAEIRILLGHRRKARALLEQLRALSGWTSDIVPAWMVERLLLHTTEPDKGSLERVVDLLVQAGQQRYAATYASALIQLLDSRQEHEAAIAAATRLSSILPGHTRITLEGAILAVRHASHGEVIDLWEAAVANGADPDVARASMAASVASTSEDDHWRLLVESLERIRDDSASLCRDAYLRTAAAAGDSPVLKAGRALVLHAVDDPWAKDALAAAAGDRNGSPIGRAAASIALADRLSSAGKGDEYVAAVRTTLTLMANEAIRAQQDWRGLTGVEPNLPELSTELGEALLEAGDAAGAVDILRVWHKGGKQFAPLVRLLAEAYARTGQVGSALTILDELGMHHRKAGQLDEMAAVLRQMSRLAPTNIKVKSRLIDAYLQRGFVSEARAELIQRADLELQAGQPTDACRSLQRAADLSWNLGFMNEAFSLYDRLLEIDPDDVGNRSALVNLYLQVGRLTEAAEHQRAVVDLALRNGRRHEAIAALHQVIGLTPDDMTAYYQLGELLSSMGEYQQAEKVYRRVVLMMPDDAVAQAKATAMAALKEQMTAV